MAKKTLKAVKAREAELLETVTSPLEWLVERWLPVTLVTVVVVVGAVAWGYHTYVVDKQVSDAWELLQDAREEGGSDLTARSEALQQLVDGGELTPQVMPFALLDLGLAYEDGRREDEATATYQRILDEFPDHLTAQGARAHLDALAADAQWMQEHAQVSEPLASTEPNPVVRFITSKGPFEVELFEDQVPNSTANLISLVEQGWYDSCVVHRVEPPEQLGVVQFGRRFNIPAELRSISETGPGYRIKAEIRSDLHHDLGTMAMAREAGYDSASSQVFINTRDNRPSFDGRYTVIGKVVSGMDAVEQLLASDDLILKAEVISKRDHEYVPETLPVE
jgi:cyclophilin family peptidyl-prolyl cis-trans isomerase